MYVYTRSSSSSMKITIYIFHIYIFISRHKSKTNIFHSKCSYNAEEYVKKNLVQRVMRTAYKLFSVLIYRCPPSNAVNRNFHWKLCFFLFVSKPHSGYIETVL